VNGIICCFNLTNLVVNGAICCFNLTNMVVNGATVNSRYVESMWTRKFSST
jgi:hypothetical protein